MRDLERIRAVSLDPFRRVTNSCVEVAFDPARIRVVGSTRFGGDEESEAYLGTGGLLAFGMPRERIRVGLDGFERTR